MGANKQIWKSIVHYTLLTGHLSLRYKCPNFTNMQKVSDYSTARNTTIQWENWKGTKFNVSGYQWYRWTPHSHPTSIRLIYKQLSILINWYHYVNVLHFIIYSTAIDYVLYLQLNLHGTFTRLSSPQGSKMHVVIEQNWHPQKLKNMIFDHRRQSCCHSIFVTTS